MEKFRVTEGMIILAGPTTGKSELTKTYPSVFVDQDVIFRSIDASYFKEREHLKKGDPVELEKYLKSMDNKFVKEALAALRKGKNLLMSRMTSEMIPKFFAFIPNAKVHLMVWRDNPQEVFRLMNEDKDNGKIPFAIVDKRYKDARSWTIADKVIWLKNGQYLADVLDIPGGKIDVEEKKGNTDLAKEMEEANREDQIRNAAAEERDGSTEESKENA